MRINNHKIQFTFTYILITAPLDKLKISGGIVL